ncbi:MULTISPECIES: acetamidase/formamidase family protein [unclassified Rathayibacter]|jgi:acetamidase/formamidase|uniref:acetamidase/formamidase family protein n=1 Tax=unclassified Rathayibacter TaxID=2609250 RepID=UPI000CE7D056|nr:MULTISPECIES: acetamidase/formamidase family protein [unclassified Rathayibacter]PPF24679.1 acetamidase [Rathayibacter sp. AY1F2]PPH26773.1 acetamidase [Rathayibacter sp. AY1F9]PPH42209.1 acetamidase [Rathayibacter sp. AY1F7]PPH43114.1 acetamidase [Rathayibacter sp. AY1C9]
MPETHSVPSTASTVRSGYLDPTAPPVASIDSGDRVSFPATWTHWGDEAVFGMTFAEREPLRHKYPQGPYSMLGPVEVTGAAPGDVIECTIETLRTLDWGWNSFPLGVGALPHDFSEPYLHYFRFDDDRRRAEFVPGVEFDLDPFIGVIGTEPAGEEPTSAILSGPYGGNLVVNALTAGSSVFLPVFTPGGRVWFGDIHAVQGDGVVDQTAIETAAEELVIRYDLHRAVPLTGPLVETATEWIGFGFSDNLDDALVECLRGLITWLHAASGLSESEAYALCSLAVSFRVAQYADQTGSAYSSVPAKAVQGRVPKRVFSPDRVAQISGWLRPGGPSA